MFERERERDLKKKKTIMEGVFLCISGCVAGIINNTCHLCITNQFSFLIGLQRNDHSSLAPGMESAISVRVTFIAFFFFFFFFSPPQY